MNIFVVLLNYVLKIKLVIGLLLNLRKRLYVIFLNGGIGKKCFKNISMFKCSIL